MLTPHVALSAPQTLPTSYQLTCAWAGYVRMWDSEGELRGQFDAKHLDDVVQLDGSQVCKI